MAFTFSKTSDGDRYVTVKCINTGGAVAATKIVDASTLNFTDTLGTELLNLVKVSVSADQDTNKINGKIFWGDSTGALTADVAYLIGSGLSGHHVECVKNTYPNSNGDVWFQTDSSTYTITFTFEKVQGFYSSRKKPWSA